MEAPATHNNHDLAPIGSAPAALPTLRTFSEADLVPQPICDLKTAKSRLDELKSFIGEVMVEDVDYGRIPGTPKNTLYKPGAEKLLEMYGYTFEARVVSRVEDWTGKNPNGFGRPFFHYEVEVDVYSKRSGALVGRGIGSCNSMESRYRWRNAERKCPACNQEAIIKGKPEYGGGWICFSRKGGCGAKFKADDPKINDQPLGKVENDDTYTLVNTILKMAKKRAVVDAALGVTRSSDLFVPEDDDEGDPEDHSQRAGQRSTGNTRKGDQPQGPTVVIAGQRYTTGGVTQATALRLIDVFNRYVDTVGKGSEWLKEKFGKENPLELNEEQAQAAITALKGILDDDSQETDEQKAARAAEKRSGGTASETKQAGGRGGQTGLKF